MLHRYKKLMVHVKSEKIYADFAGDDEKRFDTSNYEFADY